MSRILGGQSSMAYTRMHCQAWKKIHTNIVPLSNQKSLENYTVVYISNYNSGIIKRKNYGMRKNVPVDCQSDSNAGQVHSQYPEYQVSLDPL